MALGERRIRILPEGVNMKAFDAAVNQRGQVTIPRDIREAIGLGPRDRVRFEVEGETIKLRRAPSAISDGYGSVTPRNRPEDFRRVREEFERGVAAEVIAET